MSMKLHLTLSISSHTSETETRGIGSLVNGRMIASIRERNSCEKDSESISDMINLGA